MKKNIMNFFFVIMMTFIIVGCQNTNSKNLVGNWKYTEQSEIQFFEDNYFQFSKCLNSNTDNYCSQGYALWSGRYNLNGNVVSLKVENENQLIKFSDEDSSNSNFKFIVNFDDMYLCPEIDELDCEQQYKKNDDRIVKKDITKERINFDEKIKAFSDKILI